MADSLRSKQNDATANAVTKDDGDPYMKYGGHIIPQTTADPSPKDGGRSLSAPDPGKANAAKKTSSRTNTRPATPADAPDITPQPPSAQPTSPAPQIMSAPQSALTWTDPAPKLIWAGQDNGSDVNWNQAYNYCQSLRLGGYSIWRLPTIDELAGIYDQTQNVNGWHVKGGIKLSGEPWSGTVGRVDGEPSEPLSFNFIYGKRLSTALYFSYGFRALCVRRSDITPQPPSAQPTPPAPQIVSAPQSAPTWRQEQIDNYCADNPGSWIAFDNHRVDCLTPPNPPNLKWAKWELNAWHRTYKDQEKTKSSRLSVDQMHSSWDYWRGVYCSLAESGATYKDLNGKKQRCY
jgi:hypothetical protein